MSSHPENKTTYIPSLDGMRAAAILIVFLDHAGLKGIPGGFGVTVFFFISGYLITTLLRQEYQIHRSINFKYFFIRRILRIWPAFYLVLLLGVALTQLHLLAGEITLPGFLSQCLHFTNYYSIYIGGGQAIGSGVYWSLAVEEHFYLALPLIYVFMLKRLNARQQMYLFAGLCLADLLWRCVLVFGFGVSSTRTYYASDTRFDSLLFGCALAVYGNPVMDPPALSERRIKYVFVPIGIGLILFSLLYRNPEFRETFRYSIQGIGLLPIFIAAIRFPEWGPFRLLNLKMVRFIGLLSYSLYLVHHTIILTLKINWPHLHGALLGTYSLILSFTLAYLIYVFVEIPFSRLRKQFKQVS
ncbi:MAG: acyltransferase 3 [Gallionellaceae bacterium]|nr:MAG: acyltransferase 3 [Gallionellaceae bacterium]